MTVEPVEDPQPVVHVTQGAKVPMTTWVDGFDWHCTTCGSGGEGLLSEAGAGREAASHVCQPLLFALGAPSAPV